jgi:hypothetical protein
VQRAEELDEFSRTDFAGSLALTIIRNGSENVLIRTSMRGIFMHNLFAASAALLMYDCLS